MPQSKRRALQKQRVATGQSLPIYPPEPGVDIENRLKNTADHIGPHQAGPEGSFETLITAIRQRRQPSKTLRRLLYRDTSLNSESAS
ncbi:MAG: hypothetical protein CME21_16955 [Gemmatimonadetes bacterium]|jgi:hypothetical protein|nr:hypothetical protein [Gemmatimonadota bacterium]HCK09840.1 hypothetical protein [Candidatus Latescibacterota bacterium]